jgi:1,4-alpha-glucan branching enzyme
MRRLIRAALLAGSTAVSLSCATTMTRGPVVTPDGVRFMLAHATAKSVSIAGDFNDWSTATHPLARNGSGTWSAVVALPPGDHKFMFVVDGTEWLVPPQAEDYVDDGFGSRNGVVIVR